jgi:hypothetical protein
MKKNTINLLIYTSLSLFAAFLYITAKSFFAAYEVKIIVDQKCDYPSNAQIYYDTGKGYNEAESIVKKFQADRSQIIFNVNEIKKIKSVRYDPTNIKNNCEIYNIKIKKIGGIEFFLDPNLINSCVNCLIKKEKGVVYIFPENNDPSLELPYSIKKDISDKPGFFKVLTGAGDFFKSAALFLLVFYSFNLMLIILRKYFFINKISNFLNENAIRAVFFVSLISVLISSYPVLFFGKSFVSPVGMPTITNNGTWIKNFSWYGVDENYRGSDVGAMIWAIKPNSIVAGRSVFEHYEFPFYNRYVGAGAPLYSQACNLIGDPLNYIPYFFQNSETGWDVKFILSRLIFVFGIGVMLLKLNLSKLPSILLTTFASSFIGYFAFRFNHPAIFCLTYAPWLLFSWVNFSNCINNNAASFIQRLIATLLLFLFSWLMLNSGTIKETLIFVGFLHFIGGCIFFFDIKKRNINFNWLRLVIVYCSLGLLYTPYLLTFLDALHQSYTLYDKPSVNQLNWGHLLGLFNISYSPMLLVSTNLFFLFGIVAYFNNFKFDYIKEKIIIYPALLSFLIVFGVIPAAFLVKVPFVNNIIHVWNVFSIPVMFSIIIISSLGLEKFINGNRNTQKNIYLNFVKTFCILFLFTALYFLPKQKFYLLFTISLLFYLLIYRFIFYQFNSDFRIKNLIIFMLLLVVPEGQHLPTNIKFVDRNIINPMPRGDESKIPESIFYIQKEVIKEPSRVVGESELMFPGISGQFGLEGVISVEPLRNKNFELLLDLMGYPDKGWGWLRLIDQAQFDQLNHGLNMLGVKYVIANKGTPVPKTMMMAFSSDKEIDVWQNPLAWPRAFFTNNLKMYQTDETFKTILDTEVDPFIALNVNELSQFEKFKTNNKIYVAADRYHLTNNKTSFHINVPTKGFVAISNAFYPDDFVLKINGKQVSYFRANMAFIGCYIDMPGDYEFEIEYYPKHFKRYLMMLLVGLIIAVFAIVNFGKFKK